MEEILCDLCFAVIPSLGKTQNGAIVSHRKNSCSRLKEIRQIVTKEFLIEEYVVKERALLEISKSLGFKNGTTFLDKQIRKHGIEKRGCKWAANTDASKEKRKNTCKEKFGVENVFQTQFVKDLNQSTSAKQKSSKKISERLRSKTKEEWKEILRKRKDTLFATKGVYNIAQMSDVKKKISMTKCGFSAGQEEEWKTHISSRPSLPQEEYEGDFHDPAFRRRIMQQQSWSCAICKKSRHQNRSTRFPLHHIDKNKKNNNRENLVFLCSNCHGKVHGRNFETWKEKIVELNLLFVQNCEICGSPGKLRSRGWVRTLCDEHVK